MPEPANLQPRQSNAIRHRHDIEPATMWPPRRANIFLDVEDREQKLEGTALLDGQWCHFWPDDPDAPVSSYAARIVNAIEWDGTPDAF